MDHHRFDRSKAEVPTGAAFAAVFVAAAMAVANECYVEEDNCTVCKQAGANILCGSGYITCPDTLLSSDAPFREVRPATLGEAGHGKKRSENYGSCRWQPMKVNPDPTSNVPCIPDGDEREALNVMGEEVYGDSCTGTAVE